MTRVAVILSGCGHLDGAEIREAILTLMALDAADADVRIFAPNIPQHHVINHIDGQPMPETRNVMVEAARIARGQVKDLAQCNASDFDALIMPGGFGTGKSISNIALDGPAATVLPELQALIRAFHAAHKPIGAICFAPALLALALKDVATAHVTLGDASHAALIESLGGVHQECQTKGVVIDEANHLVTTPAYMREDRLTHVRAGVEKLVEILLHQVSQRKRAA